MVRTTLTKTTFTSGEVSPDLLGRGDLNAYDNGALKLRNVFIQPTGGGTRRSGLRYIDTALGNGRLIPFEFNTEQTYLLVLTHLKLSVYVGEVLHTTLTTSWTESDIGQLAWTQSADTLLLTHPNYPPKKLIRLANGSWAIVNWSYYSKANRIYQPMYKFVASTVTLASSGTTGNVTLTASSDVFDQKHLGTRFRLNNKEVQITSVVTSLSATATVIETLTSTAATIDWEEQAFSSMRGYPVTVAFHQDRLVIGGSRDLPNRMWFSQSGDLFNFELGTGLDSEAIEFGILSDQVNAVRGLFSGRHLQVFTSGSEWMVTGDPLTPSNVQIKRQTRVGSMVNRYVPPLDVDGATLFVARNGQELREFIYTSVEEAYQASDIALLSHHIITTPVDQDFDQRRRLLFLVRADGKFATLTVYRAESVAAWTLHETAGNVKSVAVVGDHVFFLIQRGSSYFIEKIDDSLYLDAAITGQSASPSYHWTGLDYLNGNQVSVVAGSEVIENIPVIDGEINLASPVTQIVAGLPYTHVIEPMPPANTSAVGMAKSVRLVEACFRLQSTAFLSVDVGRGLKDMIPENQSGDLRVRAYGWKSDTSKPLWRIEQSAPFAFALLSVQSEIISNS